MHLILPKLNNPPSSEAPQNWVKKLNGFVATSARRKRWGGVSTLNDGSAKLTAYRNWAMGAACYSHKIPWYPL